MLVRALGARLFVLCLLGLFVFAVVVVHAARMDRMAATGRCVDRVVRVVVPASTVAYAERQGWPRVLRWNARLGSPWRYDGSVHGRRVTAKAWRLCRRQRFRLVS